MLLEPIAHMPPLHALAGLSADDASRCPAAGVHSVGEILAHMEFWQAWWLDRCQGNDRPMVVAAADGWPPATSADWPALIARFEAGLHRAVALGDDAVRTAAPIAPPIAFPPLAHHTIRDGLLHIAHHNAHHLGQIITTRQLIGCWPPPSGSYTW